VLAGLAEGGFRHGRDLLAADDPEALESCIAGLLADPEARERLADCARRRLGAAYRWATNLERFEEVLTAVARRPGTAESQRPFGDDASLSDRSPGMPGAVGGARSA
jgi:spore maturation protein CgeB